MLTALEEGVKGGVWYSLIDKVWFPRNLWSAWSETAANKGSPGVDGTSIAHYERDVESNVAYLSKSLRERGGHKKSHSSASIMRSCV